MKDFLRSCKGQILLTLIIGAAIFLSPFTDALDRNFFASDMDMESEAGVPLESLINAEAGTLELQDGWGQAVSVTTDVTYLERGIYHVAVNYETDAEGQTFEAIDPYFLKEDNTPEKALLSQTLDPDRQNIYVELNIAEPVEAVQFRLSYGGSGNFVFKNINLASEPNIYRDSYLFAAVFCLASLALLLYRRKHEVDFVPLLLLLGGAAWCSVPMGFQWLLDGHDLYYHYVRLYNLAHTLFTEGFPTRLYTEMGMGYGNIVSMFYPELLLVPAAALKQFGMSIIGCYKALILFINFGTAGTGYFAFSRLLKNKKLGFLAAFLYLMAPYRLIDVYTRASIGEALAMMILPLLLWSVYELFQREEKNWPWAVLSFTLLFQSHMISTELAVYFSVLFALFSWKKLIKWERLSRVLLAGGITLLLNVWYLIPFLHYSRYPMWAYRDIRSMASYSLYLSQLFDVNTGNVAGIALGRGSIQGEMPYSLGIVLLAGSILFLGMLYKKKIAGELKGIGTGCLVMGAALVYAASVYFPWELLERISLTVALFGKIQFVFRFFSLAVLCLSVTAAIGYYMFFKEYAVLQPGTAAVCLAAAFAAGVYLSNYCNMSVPYVTDETMMDLTMKGETIYLIHESKWSERHLAGRTPEFLPSEGVNLSACYRDGSGAGFSYEKEPGEAQVALSLNYFPNYRAYDETGRELEIIDGDEVRLTVILPEASTGGQVTVRYEEPAFYRAGDWLSAVTGLLFVGFWLRKKRKMSQAP